MIAQRTTIRAAAAALFTCLALIPAARAEDALHGKLSTVNGVRVLTVWGSDYERGYAHGYLLADDIVAFSIEAMLDPRVVESKEVYESSVRRDTLPLLRFDERYEQELEGMMAGISAKLSSAGLQQAQLGRAFDVDDLKALNSMADWYAFFCSSFSAWGAATADGHVLTARNLDFLKLPGLIEQQMLVVHLMPDGDRASWVSVGWCGLIGCYTGMNEYGVTISMHDSPPRTRSEQRGFVPRSLALRDALEAAGTEDALATVEKVLRARPAFFGNNVHVSVPYDHKNIPAAVFEYDGDLGKDQGVSRRTSAQNGSEASTNILACTNHYRLRRAPTQCARFAHISNSLNQMRSEDRKLDQEEAFKILKAVSVSNDDAVTAHSIFMLPDTREFYLSLATPTEAAPNRTIKHFKISELLKQPK